jgi:hypothetical protein
MVGCRRDCAQGEEADTQTNQSTGIVVMVRAAIPVTPMAEGLGGRGGCAQQGEGKDSANQAFHGFGPFTGTGIRTLGKDHDRASMNQV